MPSDNLVRIVPMGRPKPVHVTDAQAFGARVREARQRKGLSLREAAIPGCSASFLSRVESGQRVPSPGVIVALAARLGAEPEDLLGTSLDHRVDATQLTSAEIAARLEDPAARPMLESLGVMELDERHDERAAELLHLALVADTPTGPGSALHCTGPSAAPTQDWAISPGRSRCSTPPSWMPPAIPATPRS